MPKFFRNFRIKAIELNKVRNYLLYAVGEIILVVIGIALAVQFNDWKEDRANRKQLVEHYEDILLNLEADSSDLIRVSNSTEKSLKSAEELITQIFLGFPMCLKRRQICRHCFTNIHLTQ